MRSMIAMELLTTIRCAVDTARSSGLGRPELGVRGLSTGERLDRLILDIEEAVNGYEKTLPTIIRRRVS